MMWAWDAWPQQGRAGAGRAGLQARGRPEAMQQVCTAIGACAATQHPAPLSHLLLRRICEFQGPLEAGHHTQLVPCRRPLLCRRRCRALCRRRRWGGLPVEVRRRQHRAALVCAFEQLGAVGGGLVGQGSALLAAEDVAPVGGWAGGCARRRRSAGGCWGADRGCLLVAAVPCALFPRAAQVTGRASARAVETTNQPIK